MGVFSSPLAGVIAVTLVVALIGVLIHTFSLPLVLGVLFYVLAAAALLFALRRLKRH